MNSSFRNLQVCVCPAHSNAPGCGKVAFYADFMRFPVRYLLENRHKIGVRQPKSAQIAQFEGKKGPWQTFRRTAASCVSRVPRPVSLPVQDAASRVSTVEAFPALHSPTRKK